MPAVFYTAVTLVALLLPLYAATALHVCWRFDARCTREWERRADYHADQIGHFHRIDPESVDSGFADFLALCAEHDKRMLARCSLNARRYSARIPRRLRGYYLARAS